MIDAAPHPALLLGHGRRRARTDYTTDAALERGWKQMARIIRDLGPEEGAKYLPIFERLDNEIERMRTRNATFVRALKVAEHA
jgi:hypothetical protein